MTKPTPQQRIIQSLQRTTKEKNILLVHHPTPSSNWEREHISQAQWQQKTYNHRSILQNELVIEYDDENQDTNYAYAKEASRRLTWDNVPHSMWHSGNKSTHIHALFNLKQIQDKQLMKEIMLRRYGYIQTEEGEDVLPDMQLSHKGHLIRAEHGVHEKTRRHKTMITQDYKYPQLTHVPEKLQERYDSQIQKARQKDEERKYEETNTLYIQNNPLYKYLKNPENMRRVGDGKKRFMFLLINVYRQRGLTQEETTQKVTEWYKESGGQIYTEFIIKQHVRHSYENQYTPGKNYLNNIKQSIQHRLPEELK